MLRVRIACAQNCASSEYQAAENWALGLAFLWPIGIPVLYACLLFKSRKAILRHEPHQLSAAIKAASVQS